MKAIIYFLRDSALIFCTLAYIIELISTGFEPGREIVAIFLALYVSRLRYPTPKGLIANSEAVSNLIMGIAILATIFGVYVIVWGVQHAPPMLNMLMLWVGGAMFFFLLMNKVLIPATLQRIKATKR